MMDVVVIQCDMAVARDEQVGDCRKISVMKVMMNPPSGQPWGWPLFKEPFVGILDA